MADIVKTLDLSNLGRPSDFATIFSRLDRFLVFISYNKEDKLLLQVYLIYQSSKSKMSAATKFGNISISQKAKIEV